MGFQLERIYDEPAGQEGYRVLVDRLWPRGVSREKARLDEWMKEIAPSPDLRSWFSHDPKRFEEFRTGYETELSENPELVEKLLELGRNRTVILLYAARDDTHNHAIVLKEFLERQAR